LEKREKGRFLMPEHIVLPEESLLISPFQGERLDERENRISPFSERGMKGGFSQ
jgi:hypothetical protein